jgi:hypothetical protein
MKYYLLLVCFLLTSCVDFSAPPDVDFELRPFYDDFYSTLERYHIDSYDKVVDAYLVSELADCTDKTVGICYSGSKRSKILISNEHWSKASIPYKRWLIFHELGHCALGLDHREQQLDITIRLSPTGFHIGKISASIMNPYIYETTSKIADQFWNQYLDELLLDKPVSLPKEVSIY